MRFRVQGISLIETLVGLAVFMIISISVYQAYNGLFRVFSVARVKILAGYIANEEMEIIRNLPYASVGTVGGVPAGVLPQTQNVTRDKLTFTIAAVIRNVDDPFDGTTKTPIRDLSPADYKLVQLDISCSNCGNPEMFQFAARVSPVGLETASTNGSLFVQVIDANGEPVSSATVQVINSTVIPQINITDSTDTNGILQIIDAPPANQSYQIIVSKSGYSTERTYSIDIQTPNPVNPHATVALQQVTQKTFAIDRVAQINASLVTETCAPVSDSNMAFNLSGAKIINTDPVMLKYSQNQFVSTGQSAIAVNNLEWDTYNILFNSIQSTADLAGLIPPAPFDMAPAGILNLKLVTKPKNPNSLLVTVKDSVTRLPLSGATVQLIGPTSHQAITGRGSLVHSNWYLAPFCEGGVCYEPILAADSVVVDNPQGEIVLAGGPPGGPYLSNGWLIHYFDSGSPSNFYTISSQPQSQPPATGGDSVKIQLASSTSTPPGATVTFLGPDGTVNTFYTLSNSNINAIHNGDRYLSYKIYLSTASTTFTPNVSDIYLTFASNCVASGQAYFPGLTAGFYALQVNLAGYESFENTLNVSAPWQSTEVLLIPGQPVPSPSPTPDGGGAGG